jgi:hypothetical protein
MPVIYGEARENAVVGRRKGIDENLKYGNDKESERGILEEYCLLQTLDGHAGMVTESRL